VDISRRLIIILSLMALLLAAGTLGYYVMYFGQGVSVMDCFYMTAITISTVGYAEVFPLVKHPFGRIFTVMLIFGGMGILAYGLSTVTAFFVEGQLTDILRRKRMEKKIEALRDHFIVVGGGATGRSIVGELIKNGFPVVVVDSQAKDQLLPEEVLNVEGDATHDETLRRANIDHCRGLFLALPSGKDNLYLTVTARMMRPSLPIVATAKDEVVAAKLTRAGATGVVSPQAIGGLRMASVMIRPDVVDFLDQMLRSRHQTLRVAQINLNEGSCLGGQTIRDSDLRGRFDLLILAVRKPDGEFLFNPPADYQIQLGDVLIVMGEVEKVEKCRIWSA
jgi:voltage-gated potassium channel